MHKTGDTTILSDVQGQLLIAMPGLEDELFNGSLIYILEHSKEGAVGIIINKILDIDVNEVLSQIDNKYSDTQHATAVLKGGPVSNNRGFVLHTNAGENWQHQVKLFEGLYLTTSADILEALAKGEDIGQFQLALGYSGWSPGQLEEELAANSWINVSIDKEILFNTPYEERLHAAAQKLGITYSLLSATGGSA
ncbi:MAG: YqgE/AlgH family protein [Pseudomonadales bacterium]|nr:YqgE/AlgH family protein [Pseudomonadales bacterium]